MNEPWNMKKPLTGKDMPHYYGDLVRKLFISAAIIMLVTLPFFQKFIFAPTYVSAGVILIVALVAGLTSPKRKEIVLFDTLVALIGTVIFEYHAVVAYSLPDAKFFFFTSQLLALIFLLALYFTTKTLRGHFQN